MDALVSKLRLFTVKSKSSSKSSSAGPSPRVVAKNLASVKTWDDYNKLYAAGRLGWENPPAPPAFLGLGATEQYVAPTSPLEPFRQLALDNLISPSQRRTSAKTINLGCASYVTSTISTLSPASPTLSTSSRVGSLSSSAGTASDGDDHSVDARTTTTSRTPHELNVHGLQTLAQTARERFKTGVSVISFADRAAHVFQAEDGFSALTEIDRGSTACSHSITKAMADGDKKETFVVLDISTDWRFMQGNFGAVKFYASASIYAPSPLGAVGRKTYPVGTFCVLDPAPRTSFSDVDRQALLELAQEASQYFQASSAAEREVRIAALEKQDEAIKEKVSSEMERTLEREEAFSVRQEAVNRQSNEAVLADCSVTAVAPSYKRSKYTATRVGVPAARSPARFKSQSLLNLTTTLLAETLDLTFAYLIAVNTSPTSPPRIELVAGHNLPPGLLYDLTQHRALLHPTAKASLLFLDPNAREEKTGIIVRVPAPQGQTSYLLGGFSEERGRVLNSEDLSFFRSFGRSLSLLV